MAVYNGTQIKFNNSALLAQKKDVQPAENKPAVLATSKTSNNIALKFGLMSGGSRSLTLQNPREDLTDEEVAAAMAGFIANGEAFEDVPEAALSAKLTSKTTNTFDIEEVS